MTEQDKKELPSVNLIPGKSEEAFTLALHLLNAFNKIHAIEQILQQYTQEFNSVLTHARSDFGNIWKRIQALEAKNSELERLLVEMRPKEDDTSGAKQYDHDA